MSVETAIRDKISQALTPIELRIENESGKHAGHAGARDRAGRITGETHFRVVIVSDAFQGRSLVERHRLVNEILKEELAGPVHALAIKASTPQEAGG